MKKIAIINYGLGNLFSIKSACNKVGMNGVLTDSEKIIMDSDAIILPGVGSFNEAMKKIKIKKLDIIIKSFFDTQKPVIGICLGMQLFFEKSYENKMTEGLKFIKGDVRSFNSNNKLNYDLNIGWYSILKSKNDKIMKDIKDLSYMYFVHSYYCNPADENIILTKTKFNNFNYCSSIKYKNLYGFQFHPEKSGENGLNVYNNLKKILS